MRSPELCGAPPAKRAKPAASGRLHLLARWAATPDQLRVDLAVPGSKDVAVPLPTRVRGKIGVGLLAAAVPLTAIGLGFTFADLQPYRGDPDRRLDLHPVGAGFW